MTVSIMKMLELSAQADFLALVIFIIYTLLTNVTSGETDGKGIM